MNLKRKNKMYMHDVLAKLKEIAETTDNRDINDAIKSAEMTQTSAYRGPQKEGPEPIVEEVHEVVEAEVAEAQSQAQKAAFKKMLAAKNGDKEEATEEDEKEDDDEEIQEIDDSLNDILRLSGQSGVLGMSAPSVIIKERASMNPATGRLWPAWMRRPDPGDMTPEKQKWPDRQPGREPIGSPKPDLPDRQPGRDDPIGVPGTIGIPEPTDIPEVPGIFNGDDDHSDLFNGDDEHYPSDWEDKDNELADILRLAGHNEVTEEEFEPVNAPKEVYGDAEEQLIAMSGGLNGPKNMYPTAAGGDNPMAVQPLDVTTESLYKKYKEFFVAENNENV
jgi:hypothetical protein